MPHEIKWLCKGKERVSSDDVNCEVYLYSESREEWALE